MTNTLTELKRLHAEATQGEWFPVAYDESHCIIDSDDDSWPVAQTVEHRNAALIVAARNALPSLLACVEALEKCEAQFRFYADNHRAKGTPDGDEKAKTNDDMADACRAALASLKGQA